MKKEGQMYKKIVVVILTVVLTITFSDSILKATVEEGYWRLDKYEEAIYEEPFVESISDSEGKKLIHFSKPKDEALDPNFELGQTALLMHIDLQAKENGDLKEIYKAYLKYTSVPIVLEPHEKFTISYEGSVIKDDANLMRNVNITFFHQLLYPGRVPPDPPSEFIERNMAFPLESEMLSKTAEIVPMFPDSVDDNYVFKVIIESGKAVRSYSYVYEWINEPLVGNENLRMFVDNQLLISDVSPSIIDGRVMIPLRVVLEKFGFDISWSNQTRTVTAVKEDKRIEMVIGSPYININGEMVKVDFVPIITNDRTLISAKYFEDIFDISMKLNEEDKTIEIIGD